MPMKFRVSGLAAVALLVACGERRGLTEASARAISPGGSKASSTVVGGSSTAVDFTTAGAATFTVPEGVTSLSIAAAGGGGGGSISFTGGSGAVVTTTLSVTPGQMLDLFVGAGAV